MQLVRLLLWLLLAVLVPTQPRADTPAYRLSKDEIQDLWSFQGPEARDMIQDVQARRMLLRIFGQLADGRRTTLTWPEAPLLMTMIHEATAFEPVKLKWSNDSFYMWGSSCELGCSVPAWIIAYAPTGDVALALGTPYDFERKYEKSHHLLLFVMACAAPELKKFGAELLADVAKKTIYERRHGAGGPEPVLIETPCR